MIQPTTLPDRSNRRRRQCGMALVVSLLITVVVSMIVLVMSLVTHNSLDMTRRRNAAVRTFYVTEGVIEKVHGELDGLYRSQGGVTEEDLLSLDIPEFEVYRVVTDEGGPGLSVALQGEPVFEILDSGAHAGLYAYKQAYIIDATVAHARSGISLDQARRHRLYTIACISEDIFAEALPLAQFIAFYDTDLEILPGPTMFLEGRVHTNSDLYLGSHNSLRFTAGISAVGDVFRQRLDDPGQSMVGDIVIEDDGDIPRSLRNNDGSWLDSTSEEWAEEAIKRFGGQLKSADHNVPILRLPIEFTARPHQILERASETDSAQLAAVKFENKAALRIIDGVGYDENGSVVPLTYPDPANPSRTKSIVRTVEWYDQRERKRVKAIEVNVGNLIESGIDVDGEVLYVDHNLAGSGDLPAVRLVNGADLPDGGFSVASPKPVYILGDYNTSDKTVSLVAGDAVNILSKNWSDARSTSSLSYRTASNTTVNTVMMTGKVSTIPGERYSGGLENLPRFSENWSGKTLTFRGSFICMWDSEVAVGAWRYGDPVYTAPNRDWRYDTMYQNPMNSPPGIPVVYTIETVAFRHRY